MAKGGQPNRQGAYRGVRTQTWEYTVDKKAVYVHIERTDPSSEAAGNDFSVNLDRNIHSVINTA